MANEPYNTGLMNLTVNQLIKIVTKQNIHNMTSWPQNVSAYSCTEIKGVQDYWMPYLVNVLYFYVTFWQSGHLIEVKTIKNNPF